MPETNPSPRKKPPTLTDYGKYAGMGFQMAAIIGLGTYAGVKLDHHFGLKKFPAFTLLFSLLSVIAAIYFSVKDLLKKK
ncbi:MAG: AtpZ/AtpI family protein [Bacteroidetes bacterium]|nr:AtpZ/AtpI family protein [Bacteroidota bacterium]